MQELSPTTDANLVNSLMQMIMCQIDEFYDESKMTTVEEREMNSWLEVSVRQVSVTSLFDSI